MHNHETQCHEEHFHINWELVFIISRLTHVRKCCITDLLSAGQMYYSVYIALPMYIIINFLSVASEFSSSLAQCGFEVRRAFCGPRSQFGYDSLTHAVKFGFNDPCSKVIHCTVCTLHFCNGFVHTAWPCFLFPVRVRVQVIPPYNQSGYSINTNTVPTNINDVHFFKRLQHNFVQI